MFEKCIEFVFAQEGEYSNDPNDRGGETLYGVARKYHPSLLDQMLEHYNVGEKGVAKKLAGMLYQENYWKPLKCDRLPYPLNLIVLDCAVNHGTIKAAKLLQEAINLSNQCSLSIDGRIGPKTIEESVSGDVFKICCALLVLRVLLYSKIANAQNQRPNLRGWIKRVEHLTEEILKK